MNRFRSVAFIASSNASNCGGSVGRATGVASKSEAAFSLLATGTTVLSGGIKVGASDRVV